ncbi:MAG TPA: minor capsid protein [Firmicutes bacterium]|nr:minor capsid protein [Bacillota bacterium]
MSKTNDYWRKREEDALRHYISEERKYDKELKKIYADMLAECRAEIDRFYGKYAAAEKITITEAKRRVAKLDIEAYERKAKRYVKEKNFSQRANEEMRLYNATMKINRLEMLKANIGLELISGHDELDRFMAEVLKGRTMDELTRQAGILGKTIRGNAKMANSIVNASFHNATFSQRVWSNLALLQNELNQLLQRGLIQGKNPRELARDLRKAFDSSVYHSERLMRTELARVQIDAQKKSFEENGFEHYEFIANANCCDSCQRLNGKHFEVKKMTPGENAAPLHPNCRCSVAAWEDSEDYDAWLDYLSKGGTTEEWNRLQKAEKSVAKKFNSGIIESGARITNLFSKEADDFAEMYYKEIRSFSTDSKRIAENLGKSEEDIKKVKAYLFEDKSLFDSDVGQWRRFDPDCAIAQSWQRLMIGKDIKPHDKTLIEHELLEMKIKKENPQIEHLKAHEIATRKYNYQKEAEEYYGNLKKHRKD